MSEEELADGVELILVSYHSADQIAGLLAGLPANLAVAVVDNASGADGAPAVVRTRDNARYLDSGGGKGYAKAANLGAQTSTAEYLVFGNPDSRPTAAVITALVDSLRIDPTIATVSAVTVDGQGRADLGVGGWEPTLRRTFAHAFGLHKIYPSAGIYFPPQPEQVVVREWVTGACMAVRRETFLALGGFDERYFVYNEDMAFGRQVRAAGLRQVIRGDLKVFHLGAASGAGSLYMARLRGASMIAYLRNHHRPATAEIMRAALVAGYVLRIAECLLTRRWQRARGFVAYVNGLIFGRGNLA